VDAVHAKGSIFFCQLWHVGRASHQGMFIMCLVINTGSEICNRFTKCKCPRLSAAPLYIFFHFFFTFLKFWGTIDSQFTLSRLSKHRNPQIHTHNQNIMPLAYHIYLSRFSSFSCVPWGNSDYVGTVGKLSFVKGKLRYLFIACNIRILQLC
jgi:hypothetical protein